MTEQTQRSQTPAAGDEPRPGGVTLVDLTVFLWAYKWVLAATVAAFIAAALVYAIGRDRVYEIQTTIELGWFQSVNGIKTLEPPDDIIAKLNSSFIPAAVQDWSNGITSSPEQSVGVTVVARRLAETNLIQLSSPGKPGQVESIKLLHREILGMLMEDQRQRYELEQRRLHRELETARIRLDELEDERVREVARKGILKQINQAQAELDRFRDVEQLYRDRLEALESRKELVESQIVELGKHIEEARAQRQRAVTEVESGSEGMTLMLIDSALQQSIERRARLEELLVFGLPGEQAEFEQQLAQALRQQSIQSEEVARLEAELEKLEIEQERAAELQRPVVRELESRLDSLKMPRAVIDPRRSLRPIDAGSKQLLALAFIAGSVVALFLAGLLSLIRTARSKLREQPIAD